MHCRLPHLVGAAATVAAIAALPAVASADYLGAIGAPGAPGPSTLQHPWGVTTDAAGLVYVTDAGARRVSVFDSAGRPIRQFGSFSQPAGIVVDGDTVLVADRATNRVMRFTAAGAANGTFGGGPGTAPGQFQQPDGLALGRPSPGGGREVFVTSALRFARFTPNGAFITGRGAAGSGPGQFKGIAAIAIGPDGAIYTADTVDDKIERFNADQSFSTSWFGYTTPTGLAFDAQTNQLWIADRIRGVTRTGPTGDPLGPLETSGDGKLIDPVGVAVDCRGTAYVSDSVAGHVQKYGPRATAVAGNLLRNGSFEEGGGSCSSTRPASGAGPAWSTDASTSTTHYGAGGFPGRAIGDGLGGGESFLAGGVAAAAIVDQLVDVSAQALDIDDGRRLVTLSGLLGGLGAQDDAATVEAIARDAAGQPLGTLAIGPVTAADRGSTTGLLARSAAGTLPAGTRSIRVRVRLSRASGATNDAYADNLAVTLSPQRPAQQPAIPGAPAAGSARPTAQRPAKAGRARVTLSLVGAGSALRARRLVVRVGCDRRCSVRLAARSGARTLATRRVVVSASGSRRVTLRLNRAEAAALSRRAKPSVTLAARGGRRAVTKKFGLR